MAVMVIKCCFHLKHASANLNVFSEFSLLETEHAEVLLTQNFLLVAFAQERTLISSNISSKRKFQPLCSLNSSNWTITDLYNELLL
jgi:hypothetical protein